MFSLFCIAAITCFYRPSPAGKHKPSGKTARSAGSQFLIKPIFATEKWIFLKITINNEPGQPQMFFGKFFGGPDDFRPEFLT